MIEAPEPTDVPPQLVSYHAQLAPIPSEPPETVKLVEPPGQTESGVARAAVAALELLEIVMMTLSQMVVLHIPSALA